MGETRPYYSTFSLPTTKSGKSQIVPPPPWIYAIEMIGVKVYFDLGKVLDLISPPLEIVDG